MKKSRSRKSDDLRPEYDFSKLGPAVRGKYYKRVAGRPIVVELVPNTDAPRRARTKRKASGRRPKRG